MKPGRSAEYPKGVTHNGFTIRKFHADLAASARHFVAVIILAILIAVEVLDEKWPSNPPRGLPSVVHFAVPDEMILVREEVAGCALRTRLSLNRITTLFETITPPGTCYFTLR
jgi:uncharacterized membrane protein